MIGCGEVKGGVTSGFLHYLKIHSLLFFSFFFKLAGGLSARSNKWESGREMKGEEDDGERTGEGERGARGGMVRREGM